MARLRLGLVLWSALTVASAQWPIPVAAFQPSEDADVFEITLREVPPIMNVEHLGGAANLQNTLATRYGGEWHTYLWNPLSNTPELAYGSGVSLSSVPLGTQAAAEAAAMSFIERNADLLGAVPADLKVAEVPRGAGKVAVHFVQQHHGVPVEGSRVFALFTESGRLIAFGSTFHRNIDVNPVPALGASAAAARAQADLPFNPATDRILEAPELRVLPVPGDEAGVVHHLTWRVVVGTSEPYGAWVTHVDAHSGAILQRVNDVHHAYSGNATGSVDTGAGYCANNPQSLPLRDMFVTITGIGSVTTDSTGAFLSGGTGGNRAISALLDGPLINVNDVQFGDAVFNGTIQENVPFNIHFNDATPSRRSERDVFYWVNKTNAYVKSIDPTWSIPKHTASVNVNSSCNANWTTWHMNFFREGGGCANTGIINDVVAHEYGHGIQHTLIGGQGGQGLGEGNADISGTNLIDDSVIGRGFNLNVCTGGIRDCENLFTYPDDVIGQEIHFAGQVICGFNWDTRQALEASLGQAAGKSHCGYLWHYSRKLLIPTTQPAQVLGYFIMDDDDANLENGTPHLDEICEGATNHGFACPEFGVIITHSPLSSTTDHNNDYTVSAEIRSTVTSIDIASVFYRIDGGSFSEVSMANVGGNIYEGDIPAQAQDASVEYYIYGKDASDNERTHPTGAPSTLHQFYVASSIDALEVNSGWTVGAAGDNATTGIWVRVDPNPTIAQPGDDHTPAPGIMCFVTGQGPIGGGDGDQDVDNGTTTLFSPVMNLSQATQQCVVAYYRWYSNNLGGAPNADNWVVDVSNDGGSTWTSVENVNPPNNDQNNWRLIEVDIIDLFGSPNLVQLRFRASDLATPSLIEGAVDDLTVLTRSGSAGVNEPATVTQIPFSVGPSQPNPFNPHTTLTYTLPGETKVEVTVFDATGRAVRHLYAGVKPSGEHAVTWDGRDDTGAALSSGVYHVRVAADGQSGTQKIVLLK